MDTIAGQFVPTTSPRLPSPPPLPATTSDSFEEEVDGELRYPCGKASCLSRVPYPGQICFMCKASCWIPKFLALSYLIVELIPCIHSLFTFLDRRLLTSFAQFCRSWTTNPSRHKIMRTGRTFLDGARQSLRLGDGFGGFVFLRDGISFWRFGGGGFFWNSWVMDENPLACCEMMACRFFTFLLGFCLGGFLLFSFPLSFFCFFVIILCFLWSLVLFFLTLLKLKNIK